MGFHVGLYVGSGLMLVVSCVVVVSFSSFLGGGGGGRGGGGGGGGGGRHSPSFQFSPALVGHVLLAWGVNSIVGVLFGPWPVLIEFGELVA